MTSWHLLAAVATVLALVSWRAAEPAARLAEREGRSSRWQLPSAAPGALPLRQRVALGAAAGVATWLWAGSLGWASGPLASVAAVGTTFVLGRLVPATEARRRAQLVAGLPQVCDLLAVCLESGLPLRSATQALAALLDSPLGAVLAGVNTRVALGIAEPEAWREVAGEPGLETLGREVARTVGSGVALAHVLRGIAVDARREALAAAEVRARQVGVKSVLPLMTCFLPAFVLLGIVPIIGGIVANLAR